jgi:ArsR family transcriptional regulator
MQLAETDIDRLAAMLRALSHPVRLEMVRTLADCGDRQCIDLTRDVSLAQSTVSEHLKVLKDAGIIEQCAPGPRSAYCLRKEAMVWLKQSIIAL